MSASLEVLNVGEGDLKFRFDSANPVERIRAANVVKDMLKRGYALLVETEPGTGKYIRCTEFDADTCEYIIADGPWGEQTDDQHVSTDGNKSESSEIEKGNANVGSEEFTQPSAAAPSRGRKKRGKKKVSAATHGAVAVPKTSGG